jgi:hypothetical protein
MKLALIMLIAYVPLFWWMFKQAREDMNKDEASERKAQYLSNKQN